MHQSRTMEIRIIRRLLHPQPRFSSVQSFARTIIPLVAMAAAIVLLAICMPELFSALLLVAVTASLGEV